ncbi:hypothetical protein ILYODFUR_022870 [Ilyodon furcidens]|uniref:Uncharacterized protein n=1 Tax=Ilyodon furcidens TaxID=33524 RepID=A0ABV0UIN6_9TELE
MGRYYVRMDDRGLHSGSVGSTVALQQEGPGFRSCPFCIEFACSPHACGGSLQVLQLPHWSLKLPLGASADACLSCVSVLACDGLAVCPGCTPPLTSLTLHNWVQTRDG